ncbi:MAG: hypothetical protein J5511_00675 [Bacilli bacterium]|nr:hypothetical protein [Bacilli bacterium]
MKKTVFIPLLGLSLLLSGCDVSNIKIKTPSFAKFGDEVSYAVFSQAFDTKLSETDIMSDELLSSKLYKGESAARYISSVSRKRENSNKSNEIRRTLYGEVNKTTVEYDSKKLILLNNSEDKLVYITKTETDNTSEVTTTDTEKGAAVVDYKDQKVGIDFDNDAKTFSIEKTFTSEENVASYLSTQIKALCFNTIISNFVTGFGSGESNNDPEYHWYVNGDILTYTYEKEETSELKDADDIIYANKHIKISYKYQIKLSKNEQTLKYHTSAVGSLEYIKNTTSYRDGETAKEDFATYGEFAMQSKKVSLDSIKLSKYMFIE